MSHEFAKKHFSKPTWCALCTKFIWGIGKQGYCCKRCSYPAHPKCYKKVADPCPGVKTNYSKRAVDEAHSNKPQAAEPSARQRGAKRETPESASYLPQVDSEAPDAHAAAAAPPAKLKSQDSLSTINRSGEVVEVARSFEDVYAVGRELGRGAFSVVREATHKQSGELFAVKIISKKNVVQDLHRLAIEMDILRQVDHPNIIKLQDVFETSETLYIITEVVTGGELFDRIVAKGSYSERDAAQLIRRFVEALDYLHDMNIVHRDLKPENLLLSSPNDDTNIKLADFGLSKILGNEVMMQTACGTPGYVAPEILQARGYGREVDMWSVGVITYILLCGFPPFYNDVIPLLFESIMKADFDYPADYWDHISDDAIDFIDGLLIAEPSQRLTAKEALRHVWLSGTAPTTPLPSVGSKLGEYQTIYRMQSQAMGPTTADEDDDPLGLRNIT